MDLLKFVMVENEETHIGRSGRKSRWLAGRWADNKENTEILFYVIPERMLKNLRVLRKTIVKINRQQPGRNSLCWPEKRIREKIHFERRAETENVVWMHRFWKEQSWCSNLIVMLSSEAVKKGIGQVEQIVRDCYDRLNQMLIVGIDAEALEIPYFEDIYLNSGLVAELVSEEALGTILKTVKKSGKTVWIDLRQDCHIPWREIPEQTVYLDMTSDSEKERLLWAKRKDIRYITLWNFLDTYGRNRYNIYRCQKV